MNATAPDRNCAESPPGLRELFDAHYEFVYRSACRLGVPCAAVDDVVQETFIVAGGKLHTFEGRSCLRTWLFGIAMRVAHTHRRGEFRRQRRAAVVAQHRPEMTDPYAQQEAADLLHRALDELDDDHRATFVLADFEGMTAVEISDGLGVNINTIYSRIRSARKRVEGVLRALQTEGAR